jgi:AcrR family transcriptional regulator
MDDHIEHARPIATNGSDAAPEGGRRERNKAERRRRIKQAARAVFAEKGFEAATTREIAARAGVANGTLFLYAPDKVDLLMMIVNDELDPLTRASLAVLSPARALLDQLMEFFADRYEYWARDPRLSRSLVRETFNHDGQNDAAGPETRRFHTHRARAKARIAEIVRAQQREGLLRADADADQAARLLWAVYLTEVHEWLNGPAPKLADGLARLEELMHLAVAGLEPQDKASHTNQTNKRRRQG